MKLELELNVAPITINHYHKITTRGKHASKYKTAGAVDFEKAMDRELYRHIAKIKEFNDCYDSKKHYLVVDYRFYFPIFTKKMLLPKRKNDVDNFIKAAQDNIFNYMKPDDSEIVSLTASKINSDTPKIKVTILAKHLTSIQ